VFNVAVSRSVRSFFDRYLRWSVIHRTAISLPTYLGQALLNPGPLAVLAVLASPSPAVVLFAALVWLLKGAVDVSAARALRCDVGPSALAAVVVKDSLLFVAWVNGLISRTVWWRGNRLRVEAGSRLVPTAAETLEPAVATR
ncbi:MAG: glycosyl transferase, partial [Archangium sp.]|nr:glycosyl transferase [Archangium sp.]